MSSVGEGILIRETDLGSKKKARTAIKRIKLTKKEQLLMNVEQAVDKITMDAKRLCPVGSPATTGKRFYRGGSLKRSIRKQQAKQEVSKTGYVAREDVGFGWRILAGGPPYINPNYPKIVDYAQAVHDGTGKMAPRPFLTDALEMNRATLDDAIDRYLQHIEKEWARD